MTIDQAKAMQFKGVELGMVEFKLLKWIAKNHIKKELRDAAILVVNTRSKEVGERAEFKPSYQLRSKAREVELIDYSQGAFGKLKEELDAMVPGLF